MPSRCWTTTETRRATEDGPRLSEYQVLAVDSAGLESFLSEPVRVGVLGCGNVGAALIGLIAEQVAKVLQVPKSWVYEQSRVWVESDGDRGIPTVRAHVLLSAARHALSLVEGERP